MRGYTVLDVGPNRYDGASAIYFEWMNLISNRSDEGLTLETSAFLLFTVANLRFQPSC